MNSKEVLFLLPDCPGYFVTLFYEMGRELKVRGYTPLYAVTTPFYENFKKVNLSEVGKVYYLDEFLRSDLKASEYAEFKVNRWSYYASFSRQTYFFNSYLPSIDDLKKTKLFFQTIFNKHQTTLLVSEGVSNAFLYLAHEQATVNHLPFFGLMGARIPFHFNIHTDVTGNEVLINKVAPNEFRRTDSIPDYMNNSQFGGLFDREFSMWSFSFLRELWRFFFLRKVYSLETGNTKSYLSKVYRIAFKRIVFDFYFRKLLRIYKKDFNVQSEGICAVYPLHFYPEASTSIFAKYFDGDEYSLIKNIAFSLPENSTLVVKEHKSNVGNNSREFYMKLKKLPGVILLDPYYNLKDNLEKFDAVITISSTAGFEALTKNIPVYLFGEVFYQCYPGAQKINSYSEMEEKLLKITKMVSKPIKNEAFNIYSRISFPGSFNYMSVNCLNQDNLSLLIRPIEDYLKTGQLNVHRNDRS